MVVALCIMGIIWFVCSNFTGNVETVGIIAAVIVVLLYWFGNWAEKDTKRRSRKKTLEVWQQLYGPRFERWRGYLPDDMVEILERFDIAPPPDKIKPKNQ